MDFPSGLSAERVAFTFLGCWRLALFLSLSLLNLALILIHVNVRPKVFCDLKNYLFSAKFKDMSIEMEKQSQTRTKGRPQGSKITESSTLIVRLREKSGMRQQDVAQFIGAGISTVRRYEAESIIPTQGAVRMRIDALAKKHGLTP